MADVWYYTQNGQQQGPVDNQELNRLARDGHVSPDDLVWTEGMISWARAGDTLDAFGAGPTGGAATSGAPASGGGALDASDILGPGQKEPEPRDPYGEPESDRRREDRGREDRGRDDDDLFGPAGHEETGRRRRRGGDDRDYDQDYDRDYDRGGRRPERGRGRRDDYDRDYDRGRRRRGPRDDYGRGRRGGPRSRRRPPKRGNGGLVIGLIIGGVFLLLIVGGIIVAIVNSGPGAGGKARLGATQNGRLQRRGRAYYTVNLRGGKAYVFDVTSSGMDTRIEIRDDQSRFSRKTSSDGQGVRRRGNSRLIFVPSSSGNYQVIIRPRHSWDSGSFQFTVREAKPLNFGQSLNENLSDGDEMMLYEVQLTRNQSYYFEATAAWDTHMYLYDSRGNRIREDDNGAGFGTTNSKITYRASRSGTHYVGVTHHRARGVAGPFTIGFNTPGGRRVYSQNRQIFGKGKDSHKVSLRFGKTYTILMTRTDNSTLDPEIKLYDTRGNFVRGDDDGAGMRNSKIVYRATQTGVYRIECFCHRGRGGRYRIEVFER